MSVRHINAKPGEYIAVHRNGGGRPSRGGGGGGCDLNEALFVIGIILFIFYWKEIITIAIILAIVAIVAMLIWTFRTQIWKGLCYGCTAIWRGLCFVMPLLWKASTAVYNTVRSCLSKSGRTPQSANAYFSQQHAGDYGRIIQKHRRVQ